MNKETYEDVAPPVHGQIFKRAHSATAARLEIPPSWKNQHVTFSAGALADLHIAVGDAGVKVSATAVSTVVGETIAPHWASTYEVPAGTYLPVPMGANTHFSVVSGAASGYWTAAVSSGSPNYGETLESALPGVAPALRLDAGRRSTVTLTASAITVPVINDRVAGYTFAEATNMPDWLDATAVSSGMLRPALSFVAGSSEKLVSTNANLCALFSGTSAHTIVIPVRRTATTAAHTLFSAGTTGSDNGRFDITMDASEDLSITRVTAAGSSVTGTYATSFTAAMWLLTVVFDGTDYTTYIDRTAVSLTGSPTGDVGTLTKVAVGCRAYNTSTYNQFASAELSEVIAYPVALSAAQLGNLHAWLKRRYGK